MKNLSPIRPTQAVDFVHIDCIEKIAENCLQKFNEIVKSDPTLKIDSFILCIFLVLISLSMLSAQKLF